MDEAERTLAARTAASLPRDLDSLEHLVIEHKEFETRLQVGDISVFDDVSVLCNLTVELVRVNTVLSNSSKGRFIYCRFMKLIMAVVFKQEKILTFYTCIPSNMEQQTVQLYNLCSGE